METENKDSKENNPPQEQPPKEVSPQEQEQAPQHEEPPQEQPQEEVNKVLNEPQIEEKKENIVDIETHQHNEEEEEDEYPDMMGPKKPNFEYPEGYKEKEIKDVDLPNKLSQLYEILGQDAQKRYNCYFLNKEEILMAVANTFQIFNLETKERKIFPSTEVGGVGAITKHPSEQIFAVGECGYFPNIYIYKYIDNTVKLYRILRKGTEQAYSALTFYSKGDNLASVGSEPDYNLVIWNWKKETIILKAKAFSQEIFRVSFSDNFEGKLITCGMGHIRFWEMATTFTGLKLQGELGKFGQIDLSDISSFVEFPDGKVLCGTEHGTFLLWEGIFVKANLSEPEGKKCHTGLVEHMSWEDMDDINKMKVMTAAHDGYIKWWKYLDIENVMLDDNSNGFITPVRTVLLTNPENNRPIKIISLVKREDFWLVQDGNGYLVKVIPSNDSDNFEIKIISSFISDAINKTSFIPGEPAIISQGADKKISICSFASNMKSFPQKILLEDPSPLNIDIKPTACDMPNKESLDEPFISAVGYNNGLFKIFAVNPGLRKLDVIYQARPHENEIIRIKFSADGAYLCTCTKKEIFLFFVEKYDAINPLCCIQENENQIVDMDWHPNSKYILVGYTNGTIDEIEVPIQYDKSKTFIFNQPKKRTFKIKQAENQIEKMDEKKRQRLKEAGKLKEEPEPGSVFSCKYANLYEEGDFLVTSQKPYNEFLYLCTFNFSESNIDKRPINSWKMPPGHDYYVKYLSKNFIFLCTDKGAIQIRNKKLIDKYVEIFPNLPGVQVTSITTSLDEKFINIAYENGINSIYSLDNEGYISLINSYATGANPDELELDKEQPQFSDDNIENVIIKLKQGEFNNVDVNIDYNKMLSLENGKQEAQEKEKERIANEKKEKLKLKVKKLREDFHKLKELNNKLPEEIRLTKDELIIDYKYLQIVEKEKEENLEDVENKYRWLKANVNVVISKIKSFLLSSIDSNIVTVFAFRVNEGVSSLRCPSLPPKFEQTLEKLENDLKNFRKKIDFDTLLPKYLPLIQANVVSEEEERKKFEELIQRAQDRRVSQEKKKSAKQVEIEPEIEETKKDVNDIKEMLDSKNDVRKKILDKEEKSKAKKKKNVVTKQKLDKIGKYGKCPEIYNLKTSYERHYDEKTMLTSSRQKKKIYEYLKILYNERQNFNKKVIDLKNKKIEILKKLELYKKTMIDYNKELNVNEEYDWYNFKNKDREDDLMKIPEKELNDYMIQKINEDNKLRILFCLELKEEKNPNEEKEKEKGKEKEKDKEKKEENKEDKNTMIILNSLMKKEEKKEEEEEEDWNFEPRIRENKQTNETNLQYEFLKLNELKFNYKKEHLLKEINELIDNFDSELCDLKSERCNISFYQKLGEYELILRHKELNKLRAFDKEDKKFCDRLIKMYEEYKANLDNLKRNFEYMEQNKKELKNQEKKKQEKEQAFEKLIENERENREQLIKIFHQRKKESKDPNDDKLDQEEELNMPKNITGQMRSEIYNLKNSCDFLDVEIQRYINKIEDFKRKMNTDIKTKEALDDKRFKLIDKIRANEKQKEKYINQIDLCLPVALDQFHQIDVNGKTKLELGQAIYIDTAKSNKLDKALDQIIETNHQYEKEEKLFTSDFDIKIRDKRNLEKKYKDIETVFKNEQILKFGLEIDFNFLLQANKKTTVDRYESEYKKLKIESDRKVDLCKQKIADAKKTLQEETNNNTEELKKIMEKLQDKQKNDKKLEEKNSEITKKNSKKFVMYDLKEKKIKLKEILKLLKQQMDALKREIDIFRRKGGHIYSTIASNLV